MENDWIKRLDSLKRTIMKEKYNSTQEDIDYGYNLAIDDVKDFIKQEKIRDLEEIVDWLNEIENTVLANNPEAQKLSFKDLVGLSSKHWHNRLNFLENVKGIIIRKQIKHLQTKKEELLSNKD